MYDLNKLKPIISNDHWKFFEEYLVQEKNTQIKILLKTNDIESTKLAQGKVHQIDQILGLFDKCRKL